MVQDFWDTLVYVMYVNVWELIIAFPNGGQWAPFSKVCPLAQTSSYATAHDNYKSVTSIMSHTFSHL